MWRRIRIAIIDAMGATRAGGGRRGGNPLGPIQVSLVEQRYGPKWTYRQWHELVAEYAFEREHLERYVGTGEIGTNEDLRSYFDFSEENLAYLKEVCRGFLARNYVDDPDEQGKHLDDVNHQYYQKQELQRLVDYYRSGGRIDANGQMRRNQGQWR
jgi:hypothetical protein